MVTVADIIALPAFETVELTAPCERAEGREVRNVGILDCPPDYNEYSVYMPGEFVLTNLGFAYENPSLAEKSLVAMVRRGVAAIAVKTVYNAPISEKVRQESTSRGVPVYVYNGAYHEEVAYQSLELIQRDKEELDKGKALDELLVAHNGDQVRKKLNGIVGVTGSALQCFALVPCAGDACSFYAMLDEVSLSLQSLKKDCHTVESLNVCRYRDRILIFVAYGSTDDRARRTVEERCISSISAAGNLYCGVGEPVKLVDGDLGIRQALLAANAAKRRGVRLAKWSGLHLMAFADAVCEDRLFVSTSELYRSMLGDYDQEHGTELTRTAEQLAHAYGDIKIVAEQLHQHPNTIRYRMKKAKAILGVPDEPDRSFVNLLGLMFLPVSSFLR